MVGGDKGLELRRFDAGGKEMGHATQLARDGRVADVAAAGVGERLGVAWVERGGKFAAAYGVVASTKGSGFGSVHRLGEVAAPAAVHGGHLVVREEEDKLLVFRSGPLEACSSGDKDKNCTSFLVQELMKDGPEPRRIPLSVPAACDRGVAAFSATPGQWLYGVCSRRTGGPATTLFRIQHSPRYAEANHVLTGCTPRGSAVVDGAIVVVADCPSGRRAVKSNGAMHAVTSLDWSKVRLECARGGPALSIASRRTPLGKVVGDLSALLPKRLVPPGAKAAFTGVALFVGSATRAGVRLIRFECRAGHLSQVP